MIRCASIFYLTLCVLVLLPTKILAAPQEMAQKWLVLGIEADDFDAELVEVFVRSFRARVKEQIPPDQILLPRPQIELKKLALAARCEGLLADCVSPIGKMVGARHVLFAHLVGDVERAELRLLFLDTENERRSQITSVMTSITKESETEFRHHIGVVLGSTRMMPTGKIILEGLEKRTEVSFYLDGNSIDRAELDQVAFGRHHLEVRTPLSGLYQWSGIVRPNRATRLQVVFAPKNAMLESKGVFASYPITWSLSLASGLAGLTGGAFAWHANRTYSDLVAQQEEVSARCLAAGANCMAATICDVTNPPSECASLATAQGLRNGFLYSGGALLLGGATAWILEYFASQDGEAELASLPILLLNRKNARLGWSF